MLEQYRHAVFVRLIVAQDIGVFYHSALHRLKYHPRVAEFLFVDS